MDMPFEYRKYKATFPVAHPLAPPGAPPAAPALRSQRRPLDGGGWPCGPVLSDGLPARLGLLGGVVLGYDASGCLQHLDVRQEEDPLVGTVPQARVLGSSDRWAVAPDSAARPGCGSALTKDTDQPDARCAPHPSRRWPARSCPAPYWPEWSVRFAPDTQQPQGGHGDGQPQSAARSGLVMCVRCHCQPARFVIVKPCSIQARRPYQPALLASGGRSSGRIQPRVLLPRLPQASRVQCSCRCRPLKAMPVPRQDVPGSGPVPLQPGPHARGPWAERSPRVDAQKRVPPQPREAPQQPARVQAAIGQHDHRPRPWNGPVHLAQHAHPLPPPGMVGRGRQNRPRDRDGTAPIDHTDRQDGKARPQGRRIEGQSQLCPLPLGYDPPQQGHKQVSTARVVRAGHVGAALLPRG